MICNHLIILGFELRLIQFQNVLLTSLILPKNERKHSTLLLWYLNLNCFCLFFGRNEDTKETFEIKRPLVGGKYNQIATFWNPIVCMIYMAAVLIQLLTLKHLHTTFLTSYN